MMRHLALVSLAACLVTTPVQAAPQATDTPKPVADSGQSGRAPKAHYTPVEAASFAKQIERDLAGRQARVALVFRAGKPRDRLPDNVPYTHGAFWVYGDIQGPNGKIYKGYSSYNLYQGDGIAAPLDQSYLAQDFPLDFISANQVDDVGVIIPSPEMQRRLLALIASPTYERLYVSSYSLVSNPFSPEHQNCTEFMLDVIASAAWETSDYTQIKADLGAHFKPTIIRANIFARTFGPMLNPRLRLDDQPGRIETVTYDSIRAFMSDNRLLQTAYVLPRHN